MDCPSELPLSFLFFASYDKHREIQAIILNILSPFVDK